jgi:hypothetical protein
MTQRSLLHGLVLSLAVYLLAGTTADPDLWGHVRFGQDMISAQSVHVPDHYSFAADKTWVNHEWLAEVLMASAFDRAGMTGLIVLRLALVGGLMCLLASALPRSHRLTVMVVSAAGLGIFLRAYPIRPQLMSLLLFGLVCRAMYRADEHKTLRPLLAVPPLFAIWVNLHGGWIVGFGVFGLWTAMSLFDASWRARSFLALVIGAAAAATLVSPYGFEMWTFLADTVRVERPMIGDWQPTYALAPGFWGAWIAGFVISIAAIRRGLPARSWAALAITVGLGVMAVRVSRLDAFFTIAAVFLAARSFRREQEAVTWQPPIDRVARVRPDVARWSLATCAVILAAAVTTRASSIPVASGTVPDAHVAQFVRDQRLTGKMLTWFDWGQYVIWHFGPRLQVSMDGRRETVYSDDVIAAHLRFYFGERDEWRYADELGADYVLLPTGLPVVNRLKKNGWTTVCQGESATLLSRTRDAGQCRPGTGTATDRSFPEL